MSGFKPVYSWGRLYGIINIGVKDSTASPPEEKEKAQNNLKTMPITRKEKLKCKRKPKTHPLNRSPSGVEDKSTKPNFWYPAEVQ